MADIQFPVAGFALFQRSRSGRGLRKRPVRQDAPAAGQPVRDQAFIPDVHGAGDQPEEQAAVPVPGKGLQAGIQQQRIGHIRPDEDVAFRQPVPFGHQFVQGIRRLQGFLREGDGQLSFLLLGAADAVADPPFLGHGQHEALGIDSVSSGPAGDLLDFAGEEAPPVLPVEFRGFTENDPADRQGNAHADRVRRHDHGGFPLREPPDLLPPGYRGQGAVDHAGVDAALLQFRGDGQDGPPGKDDQGVARLRVADIAEDAGIGQGGQAFVLHGGIRRVEAFQDPGHKAPGFRRQADMDFIGIEAVDGAEPLVAPGRVGDHLGLVDDGDRVMRGVAGELDGGSRMAGALLPDGLLAGQEAAGGSAAVQRVVHFQGQETQGTEIHAAFRLLQGLDGLPGFAAVGRADMQDKAPGHFHGPEAELLNIKSEQVIPDLQPLGKLLRGFFLAALQRRNHRGVGQPLLDLGTGPEADRPSAFSGGTGNRRLRETAVDHGAGNSEGGLDPCRRIQVPGGSGSAWSLCLSSHPFSLPGGFVLVFFDYTMKASGLKAGRGTGSLSTIYMKIFFRTGVIYCAFLFSANCDRISGRISQATS